MTTTQDSSIPWRLIVASIPKRIDQFVSEDEFRPSDSIYHELVSQQECAELKSQLGDPGYGFYTMFMDIARAYVHLKHPGHLCHFNTSPTCRVMHIRIFKSG
jgi:hypothetical protein